MSEFAWKGTGVALLVLIGLALAVTYTTAVGWLAVTLLEFFQGTEHVEGFWSWVHFGVGFFVNLLTGVLTDRGPRV